MPLCTPRIRLLLDWATVSDWVPAVFRATANVCTPASAGVNVYGAGSAARVSVLVKVTVPA